MSFPERTIVDERRLFPGLPNNIIAPIRPTTDDQWGKNGSNFFFKGITKVNCPVNTVWNSGKCSPQKIPKPAPKPAPKPMPKPVPKPVPRPAPVPAPVPKPAPKPVPRPMPKPMPKPAPVPNPPSWVKGDPQKNSNANSRASGKWNADIVRDANRSNKKFDFVLYGDSITAFIKSKGHLPVFERYFGKSAVPLGVGGDTVQELSWRLVNTEKLKNPPKVVAVLIGVNNIKSGKENPVPYMDAFLLPYLKSIYPTSKIILIGLLPNTTKTDISTKDVNREYKRLADKYGIKYVDISGGLSAGNTKDFYDGLHPADRGYDILFRNLKNQL